MKGRLYLGIALTTECNYQCFYCKDTGESVKGSCGKLDFDRLKMILNQAYKVGINTFRITGGEPTMVDYLPELIEYMMNLGEDTKIRLNTNGYKLYKLIDLIERYKERINILISVDSVNEYIEEIHFPKYLSAELEELAEQLVARGIRTRFNVVVTKQNILEIPELVKRALDLGVNIKLLDLNIQNEYLGYDKKLDDKSAKKFWKDLYQPLDDLKPFLNQIATEYKEEYHEANSFGIPMSGYFKGNQTIQLKDSSKGAQYSTICVEKCPFYNNCREGVFSPFLSVGEVLHISGCSNEKLYWDLKGKSDIMIEKAFSQILDLFDNVTFQSAD